MTKLIDPYGSELVEDYAKIIKDFGLEPFDPGSMPDPNRAMRRGVVFAGRDLKIIARCIKEKKPFYVLSGIMPTNERIHFGNKLVVENIRYFQEHGGHAYMLIADLESAAARDVSLEEARKRAMDFHVPAYIALGLDPKKTTFYFQSENKDVIHLAFELAHKVTFNEFKAIYGNTDPGRIMSAITQVGDILYPQIAERMPGVIPVGIDQDPHIRLSRDIVARTRKKKFFPPSSIYHKYTPSLDGEIKMSKSKPDSCITLPEDDKEVARKLRKALTGGRETVEEQRKKGGRPEQCIIFELHKQHLIEDDEELEKIYNDCKSGRMLCGECKNIAIERMQALQDRLVRGMSEVKTSELNFIKFN